MPRNLFRGDNDSLHRHREQAMPLWALALFLTGLLWALLAFPAKAADTIPAGAARYRGDLVRNARLVWGVDAPVATFAGQIHQESRWRADAKSAYASGLAQFTPDTAKWIAGTYPADLGSAQARNPQWALRALARYDRWLFERVQGKGGCQRWAFTLSAYNGGLGWVRKDAKLASAKGADPLTWFSSSSVRGVDRFNAGRAPQFFKENRGYPEIILRRWEPLYERAGWGAGSCP